MQLPGIIYKSDMINTSDKESKKCSSVVRRERGLREVREVR